MRAARVVVENHDDVMRNALIAMLRAAGFDAVGCGGPRAFPDGECPLVTGDDCALLDDADAVFMDLDLDLQPEAPVLEALRARYPDLPIVLELPTSTARRHAARLDGCIVIPPFDADRLITTIRTATATST
jgi:AmiR/NasT family two-component response regulator